jgi:hypothetical protein
MLSESYQSGIYWAIINAEQARERAADAELAYWTKRAERDGLVVSLEHPVGSTSAAVDGIRTEQKGCEKHHNIACTICADKSSRDIATAKAILLAHIDEAQMLYDVTVNTPDAPKGLIEFMDRHLDDLRAKKVAP